MRDLVIYLVVRQTAPKIPRNKTQNRKHIDDSSQDTNNRILLNDQRKRPGPAQLFNNTSTS